MLGEYVDGVFRGTNEFLLTPVDGGRRTRLRMHFDAQPRGWVALLARVTDVGLEHSAATQSAFANLNALVGAGRPAAGPAPRERTVRTDDGAELAITVLGPEPGTGPGRTVVLAHGWAAGREVWDGVAARLVPLGHSVVLYDQRGHGSSTLGSEPISVARLAADLAAVLADVDAKEAIVAGHSGGGFAALGLATTDPTRIGALALLATAAHGQNTPDGEVSMMGNPLFSRALSLPPLGRRLLRATMGRRPVELEANRRMFAATPAQVRADCFASSRGMDLRAALPSVTLPAVVLAGDADTVVAPRLGAAVASLLPRARFERVAGAGHMLSLETPDRVALAIVELAAAS